MNPLTLTFRSFYPNKGERNSKESIPGKRSFFTEPSSAGHETRIWGYAFKLWVNSAKPREHGGLE